MLGVCETRLAFPRLALRSPQEAVAHEPGNWEYHYGKALVRAAAGLDPRAAARTAQRLNPRSALAARVVLTFDPQTLLRGEDAP